MNSPPYATYTFGTYSSFERFFKAAGTNQTVSRASKRLYAMMHGNVSIKLKNGKTYPLRGVRTDGCLGDFLCLSDEYNNTSDFMLVSNNPLGARNSRYGPITLEILESLGYATKENPKILQLRNVRKSYWPQERTSVTF